MKKRAFSYLELIISMGLVVMVVFLTTPFLTHIEKTNTAKYGEYRAYAKYLENEDPDYPGHTGWVLYQNTKWGDGEYGEKEEQCAWYQESELDNKEIQKCVFVLPKNVSNYTVHVYGGGGAGSNGYYDSHTSALIFASGGAGGSAGQVVTKNDNLSKAVSTVDENELYIYNCNDLLKDEDGFINTDYDLKDGKWKNCIGIGGEINNGQSNNKIYINRKIDDIKLRVMLKSIDNKLLSDVKKYVKYGNSYTRHLEDYITSPSESGYNNLKKELFKAEGEDDDTFYIQNLFELGMYGQNSYFRFETSQYNNQKVPTPAVGGMGGRVSSVEENVLESNLECENSDFCKSDETYIVKGQDGSPSNAGSGGLGATCNNSDNKYDSSYCNGNSPFVDEAHNSDGAKLYQFGAGGGGGAVYLVGTKDEETGIVKYEAKKGNGGRGAGGAIVIEWN